MEEAYKNCCRPKTYNPEDLEGYRVAKCLIFYPETYYIKLNQNTELNLELLKTIVKRIKN